VYLPLQVQTQLGIMAHPVSLVVGMVLVAVVVMLIVPLVQEG